MSEKRKITVIGKVLGATILFCIVTSGTLAAQTFTNLVSFDGTDGGNANAAVIQGLDGNFYGTTPLGGNYSNSMCNPNGCGMIFKLTPTGTLTTLYTFCSETNCTDGVNPFGLVQAANGNLYGIANSGGANNDPYFCFNAGCGNLFELTLAGKFTVLYSFCSQANCADGASPGGLMQAANGNLYGTTGGGAYVNEKINCAYGCGTIFEITQTGKLTTLYKFCSLGNCNDGTGGNAPIQASNGNLYGTASYGGAGSFCPTSQKLIGCGTVYALSLAGKFTSLYSFCSQTNCADGERPQSLTQGADGSFYGNTVVGGTHQNGTVYKITPSGKLTTLYTFCVDKSGSNCVDGSGPEGVVQAADGNFYGTTNAGGNSQGSVLCQGYGCGTVFKLIPGGQLTTLYSFCPQTDCLDGAYPAPLMQATDGTFYGLGSKGGTDFQGCVAGGGCGNAYSISVGLGPFVTPNPIVGRVGRVVNILGNNLTGSTSVTFNGTSAKFTVVSDTYIRAAVPTGATTGSITVVTSSGALTSNVPFRVIR